MPKLTKEQWTKIVVAVVVAIVAIANVLGFAIPIVPTV